jgi:hypothetical protein
MLASGCNLNPTLDLNVKRNFDQVSSHSVVIRQRRVYLGKARLSPTGRA